MTQPMSAVHQKTSLALQVEGPLHRQDGVQQVTAGRMLTPFGLPVEPEV